MQADKPNALLHQVANRFEAVVLEQGMAAAAITINDQRRCAGKGSFRILRPAVAINLRHNAGHLIEARHEQQTACAVFVVARAVARRAGEEDDLFILSRSAQCYRQDHQCEESSVHAAEPNPTGAKVTSSFGFQSIPHYEIPRWRECGGVAES